MAEDINLAPLSKRSGPDAEATWRDDIRRAAIAGGAPEDLARGIAAAAPTDLPAWRGGVEFGLYYGWSWLLTSGETSWVAYWPLHDRFAGTVAGLRRDGGALGRPLRP